METILLVDDDLAFIFWLGRTLDEAGYAAFPARNIADARSLIAQCRLAVDLLIINSALPGAAGFSKELRFARPNLETIAVVDRAASEGDAGFPVVTIAKPELFDSESRAELLDIVESVLVRSKAARLFGNLA